MNRDLEAYKQKRDFSKTSEPEAKTEKFAGNLRFVVQHHMASRDHFDFRLEWDGVLLSWAVPKGPSFNTRDKRLAVAVEDHPLEYRNFEGTIAKEEYGGGTVMIWDEGNWQPQFDAAQGLLDGSLKIVLFGKRLKGKWALVRMKAKPGEADKNWLLIKERDEYTLDHDGVSEFVTSAKTGRTMAEISADLPAAASVIRNPFDRATVQLAKLVSKVPAGKDWLFELKYDGYRILAYLEDGKTRLITRNGQDYTDKFQSIADSISQWAVEKSMIIDGEIVIQDAAGRTDFQALQNYLKNPQKQPPVYMVFDLLALDGVDLRIQPLIIRKEKLAELMADAPGNLHYSNHTSGNGDEIFKTACQANMEGIIGKKAASIYSGIRNGDWVKLKCKTMKEFFIGGYTQTDKSRHGISALLLGVYNQGELIYAGRAGSGFTDQAIKELSERFASLEITSSPFKLAPKSRKDEKIVWLQPILSTQIKFAEWTNENLLRQASFKGLQKEKSPHDSVIIDEVMISSPDKVMFEDLGMTKESVAKYYASVADRLLPYVENRILSILRCPAGISGECFFQKHPDPSAKGIVKMSVKGSSGKSDDYFYIDNAFGLISAVQMGTLEFHCWGSRTDHLELPDTMVFDLDPEGGMDLERVRQGVRDLKSILDKLSLVAFLKTSGGKGYHVVVPLEPQTDWDKFHDFARMVAVAMEQQWPDRYTSNSRKIKREGKIFIDWQRNGRGATSVAPYSLRARTGAPVSMPISWEELETVAPNGIDSAEAIKRIDSPDPWQGFGLIKQSLQ